VVQWASSREPGAQADRGSAFAGSPLVPLNSTPGEERLHSFSRTWAAA